MRSILNEKLIILIQIAKVTRLRGFIIIFKISKS